MLLATSKIWYFCLLVLHIQGEARAERSTASQQSHTTQIITAILSLYTIKSMPGLAIKTHCVKMSVDSCQVIFD